jgi:Zn finger protein HypA/HybF involved in hydrogenase expression
MGALYGAICKECGTKYKARLGPNMLGFVVHCDKCGKEISGGDSFSLNWLYERYTKWLQISELIAKGADEKAIESINNDRYGHIGSPIDRNEYIKLIEEVLGRCKCGGNYTHDAPPRCPNCGSKEYDEDPDVGWFLTD